MEKLLQEAESTLVFIKSISDILITADYERDIVSVLNLLETVGAMAETTRIKVTDALIGICIQKEKAEG